MSILTKPPINYLDFDYNYYISTYPDLSKSNIITHKQAYLHWLNNGCYEGRKYRNIKTNEISIYQMNKKTRFIRNNLFPLPSHPSHLPSHPSHPSSSLPITIKDFKIAILIYMYDINMSLYFKNKISLLMNKYDNIHIYIGIKTFENKFISSSFDIYKFINSHFDYKNVFIHLFDIEENSKGGDIGGFLKLSKIVCLFKVCDLTKSSSN